MRAEADKAVLASRVIYCTLFCVRCQDVFCATERRFEGNLRRVHPSRQLQTVMCRSPASRPGLLVVFGVAASQRSMGASPVVAVSRITHITLCCARVS
jgi:hypothetical protein